MLGHSVGAETPAGRTKRVKEGLIMEVTLYLGRNVKESPVPKQRERRASRQWETMCKTEGAEMGPK